MVPSPGDVSLLTEMYADFNARRIDAVLARLSPDVDWPNGWESGRIHGREEVRAYWLRQWAEISPNVEPKAMSRDDEGSITVEVHQVVRDLEGKLLVDTVVKHIYTLRDGLIAKMDIQ